MPIPNADLRMCIVDLVHGSGEGHIPSSFSIVDILDVLYGTVLKYRVDEPHWQNRDFFVLSKGHGSAGLFVVMHKYGLLRDTDMAQYGQIDGVLGGHPDVTRVPHIEASTGSLGHGFPSAVGIALGLRVQDRPNRVFALLGDGECHEGTIWESANVATNEGLANLTAVIDWNGSAAQLMPRDDLPAKWAAFGWEVVEIDGHDASQIEQALLVRDADRPRAIVAHTTKGRGVSFIEGHGLWHHRIPNEAEMDLFRKELGVA